MNYNDIADQLRLVYRMQRFQRNEKWWWALWIWGLEFSFTNAFMMMVHYCQAKRVAVPYSHHDFLERVGMAYIDPITEEISARTITTAIIKQCNTKYGIIT